ncbi:p-loop containing nucleoside triphosphate hydrolase superfamily protein [Quillaja saponaria]|uniref:P-loop containing nucleoside triphosphate hydrolase superfamily protein n=1 Tax=Quillaja saponaria TaxID=32244 RepID=A0AAD7LJ56_QUISA|nr:p-loop containing nucleoside triphosphate hydrolase superfamily protein [Quillaja saponaria]
MGSQKRPLFDLNEPPPEDNVESDAAFCFQPQKTLPSTNTHNSRLFAASASPQGIINNTSSVSGFQPFVRPRSMCFTEVDSELKRAGDQNTKSASSSSFIEDEVRVTVSPVLGSANVESDEREEGEWSDAEGSADVHGSSSLLQENKASQERVISGEMDGCVEAADKKSCNVKVFESSTEDISSRPLGMESDPNEQKSNCTQDSESNVRGENSMDGQEELGIVHKQKEVKGFEASHALRCANNPGKRKVDQRKEEMLGKKRNRKTMFLNLEDVKQAGPIKTSTPRRQTFSPPITTRTVKEVRNGPQPAECAGDKPDHTTVKDQKQVDTSSTEGGNRMESYEPKSECNGDYSGLLGRPRRLNSDTEISAEVHIPPVPRQSSWKQPTDIRLPKNSQVSNRKLGSIGQSSMDLKLGNKKHLPAKKQVPLSNQYHDTSIERLIREVTNEKFWHHPEDADLQCVPGRFESLEEYIRVFEPLLFEECRAQLYSTWEELTETVSRDTHVRVHVKSIERRERGWFDVIVLPVNECKWAFKEGDVAILSSPRPGSVRSQRHNSSSVETDCESEICGRVAGTVRRYIPIDTRDPPGAILHFYVGDSYDPSSKVDDDHILRKLQPRGIWYLTVLGSLATTQREYVALHAFRRLNLQMQTAILQPSPEHFPKYEQQTPAMPECFTQNFVDHLHRTFNGPQLAAIQWAATHTAAGTSSGTTKRQDPWPFTLVQGPPGTGKTHTVWGMLNVIHLVQYQHYYTSLLKKLAPESYKQASENNSENAPMGSIDEVLQNMDQNLFRTLPKLCPKPRMLVCAPSNAATDELLARVLDRGFIDGEMKVYRPDVARVGVDSQTRAAQAVSVERRTEQLLVKNREEVLGWMHQLKNREAQFSQQISCLQRELNVAAASVRSQGSVGVDPDVLVARDQNRDALLQNLAAVVEGRDKILVEMSRLLILESRFRAGSNFNLEEARASLEASFANEAEIVFTTVSSSGRKLFSRLTHGFDMVVIDEAAQASEVAVLPPLSLGAARCVLVGDPQQLPATVISKAAGTLLYSRSLFERFQQAGCPTMLLSVQYRMHPQIRDFPSRHFYQGRLTDSESVSNLPDEVYHKDPLLRPYTFYDITHGRESHRGGSVSYQNVYEAQICLRLYEHLQKTSKSLGVGKISVGIITPYKLQLKCLQREFEDVLKSEEGKDLYINTVDAFQGQERDVIIMSCVRASSHGVGFVADIRRMNVALTRARRALWVMGNANALVQSDDWAALIADAKTRNCYMNMDSLPKDFLVAKGPAYTPLPGKISSNARGLRSTGPRHRSMDMRIESRLGTQSEDDEKMGTSVISRNGNHRSVKYSMQNSLDDFDQSGDRSRDGWQYGVQRKQNLAGMVAKRDV